MACRESYATTCRRYKASDLKEEGLPRNGKRGSPRRASRPTNNLTRTRPKRSGQERQGVGLVDLGAADSRIRTAARVGGGGCRCHLRGGPFCRRGGNERTAPVHAALPTVRDHGGTGQAGPWTVTMLSIALPRLLSRCGSGPSRAFICAKTRPLRFRTRIRLSARNIMLQSRLTSWLPTHCCLLGSSVGCWGRR
jgi:hypothetical protein